MVPQWIIEKKRDGHALSEEEIRHFIEGYSSGDIPDYQMAALAMAIYFRDMEFGEISALTDVMMHSGDVLDTSSIPRPKVDKHSTGGIGDKVSLILAPLAASCGLAVPMISGRGLGITGGTLDKLESIPGYRTDLATGEFLAVLDGCGCSIIGQTSELAPADKKLYALRDVTGTVPSIPLICASIMCKKLAEGADSLVLDVKWGKGAFMKSREDAERLAATMVAVGARMGRGMAALISDMNQPLGRTAGNAVEVVEAIETLRGNGPEDLVEITLELTALMLVLGGLHGTVETARRAAADVLSSGTALDKFREMVRLQGGDAGVADDTSRLPRARVLQELTAPSQGCVASVDAELVGRACITLGAGRRKVTDTVNHAVGISGIVKVGEKVEAGQPVLTIHADSDNAAAGASLLLSEAVAVSESPVAPPPLICKTMLGERNA